MRSHAAQDLEFEKKFAIPGDRYHSVIQFGANTYKVIQFYGSPPCAAGGRKAPAEHSDVKLSSSISRTKRLILELALSNEWDYFITMTLDKDKVDRFDLEGWRKKFNDFLKYRRRKYGLKCSYLLVPEQHEDGAWHCHGLISGIPRQDLISFAELDKSGYRSAEGRRLPDDLINSDYLNWPDYQRAFGFCSLGPLKRPEAAAFYVTKYITKDLARCVSECGKHMYWPSKNLNRPIKFGEFYDRGSYIDSLLVNKYEFCATGIVLSDEGWDSDIAAGLIECVGGTVFNGGVKPHPAFVSAPEPSAAELEADRFYQISIAGMEVFQ